MRVAVAFVPASGAMMMVFAEEPENCNDCATEKYKEHLGPLVAAFVELCHDDLTACDVDEGTSRQPQERHIDEHIALHNLHAYYDTKGRSEREYSKEQTNLLQREARPRESSTKRNGCCRLVDEYSNCELSSQLDRVQKTKSDSLK